MMLFIALVVENVIWLIIEPCASIIAACLPVFGPFFKGGEAPGLIARSVRSVFSGSSQPSGSDSSGSHQVTQRSTRPSSAVTIRNSRIRSLQFDKYSTHISVLEEDVEKDLDTRIARPDDAHLV